MDEPTTTNHSKSPDRATHILRWILAIIAVLIVAFGIWLGHAYLASPKAIRNPSNAHFHFRMQIIADGKAVNFADDKYQTPFNKDICTAALTKEPFHFHDKLDQFTHVHWNHMTGGLLLKNYGWNLIGGTKLTLGYRFDQLPKIVRVPIHGLALPTVAKGDHYYIYTGSENGYTTRQWNDFIKEDLSDFFTGKKSAGVLNRLIPAAYAHQDNEEELTKLNDVVGSVVIFAQKTPPTDQQIKNRFNHLIDLPESSCGG